jgi:UDP-N-acetylmuramate: L-alanyl-gamma-D-glutamyl-meso-diaminopimelate ligase
MRNWLHIAGIAGKSTSNVAWLYQQMGYFVTGSDNNCLPPATDLLDEQNIPYVQGFHFSHLTREFWEEKLGKKLDVNEVPDRTIFVGTLTPKNKEYMFAKSRNINIQTYAQALGADLVKETSIVSVGTAGKTTTTALLVYLMRGLGFDPSYMIGAELADKMPAIGRTYSDWSIMEGDEFYGTEIEPHSKFFEYKPKYLLLNKITWDHADVFPTEEIYIENFRNLLRKMPQDGLVLANAADDNIRRIAGSAACQVKWFSAYEEVSEFTNEEGTKLYWHLEKVGDKFKVIPPPYIFDFEFEFSTRLLGKYNQQNVLAVVAMLYELFADNLDWNFVAKLISEFKGVRKRLELLYKTDKVAVYDDLGGPPLKVKTGIAALREAYPEYQLLAVYEPNSGNRVESSLTEYKDAFSDIDQLIFPELSSGDPTLLSAEQLVEKLKVTNVKYLPSSEINQELKNLMQGKPSVVVIFSSYRLQSLATELIKSLQNGQ